MKAETLLRLEGVTSGYGKKTVIRDVDFSVQRGQIVTLLGANGVGKTTTLKTIIGMLAVTAGRINYDGSAITALKPHEIAALGIGYCPEGRRVFGNLTVHENLMVGAYRTRSQKDFNANLKWIHHLFPRLNERRSQLSDTMSGGEQQMLAIGRALISRPQLLLLDEPSLGLAPLVVEHIVRTLREINHAGVSILLVEQNAQMALSISHHAYVMDGGRIVREGTGADLLHDKEIADIYLGFQ